MASLDAKLRNIPGQYSEVFVDNGGSGGPTTGSTNTAVIFFSRISINTGDDIYMAGDSSQGHMFIVKYDGVYSVQVFGSSSASTSFGSTKNADAASLTQGPLSLADLRNLLSGGALNSDSGYFTFTGVLRAGDIVRAMTSLTNANGYCAFRMTRVA